MPKTTFSMKTADFPDREPGEDPADYYRRAFRGFVDEIYKQFAHGHDENRLAKNLLVFADTTARIIAEKEKEGSKDRLTGLYNQKTTLALAEQTLDLCKKLQIPCGIIFIDIDDFKSYNDKNGEKKGDEAIQQTVQAHKEPLKDAVFEDVIFGRRGGEEFLVIAPSLDQPAITALAEKLQRSLKEKKISRMSAAEAGREYITCSYGIYVFQPTRDSNITAEEAIEKANVAVTIAKGRGKTGRNSYKTGRTQIVIWDEGMPATVRGLN